MQRAERKITKIQQEVILQLPAIYLKSFSNDENRYLNEWIAYTLQYAKEKNSSREVGILLDALEWGNYDIVLGTENKVNFNTGKMKKCLLEHKNRYILIHNHPSDKIFSDRDIFSFCKMEAVMGMIVVGNKGSVYAIVKKKDFNKFNMIEQYEKELIKNRETQTREMILQRTLESYQETAGFEFVGGKVNGK